MKRYTVILSHRGGSWLVYDLKIQEAIQSFTRKRDARKLVRYLNKA